MPMHDWTRVGAGTFHHYHHEWISAISSALNRGIMCRGHYALAEQITGGLGPDVLPWEALRRHGPGDPGRDHAGGLALAGVLPRVRFRERAEVDQYVSKANAIVIRHASGHEVVAIVEIVSPGNKNSRHGLRSFVDKAEEVLRGGVHLLLIDLFPPRSFDPQGIHKAVWDRMTDNQFVPPPDKPLTLAAYAGGPVQEAFVEPAAVGSTLPDMPLFLTPGNYVEVPLESTYQEAWEEVPEFCARRAGRKRRTGITASVATAWPQGEQKRRAGGARRRNKLTTPRLATTRPRWLALCGSPANGRGES